MNLIRLTLLLALGGTHVLGATVESRQLNVPTSGKTGFTRVDATAAGLQPTGTHEVPAEQAIRESHLSGLAAADVDGDGLVDVFVCGMDVPNAFYRNRGDWKFENATEAAGLALRGWRLNAAVFADVDSDGDPDLVVTSVLDSRNFLLLNDGNGRFTESLQIAWVNDSRGGSVGVTLADIDGDGDLDMYTPNSLKRYLQYKVPQEQSQQIWRLGFNALNTGEIPPPIFFEYFAVIGKGKARRIVTAYVEDQLYINDGKGGFAPVSDLERRFVDRNGRSMLRPSDPGHEAVFRDIDNDGDPDLYVTSDFEQPDRFWINNGEGFFQENHAFALRRTSQFSMGQDFADINRDGHVDFITVDMLSRSHKRRKTQMGDMQVTESAIGQIENRPQIMQNTLQLNRGDGTWTEIAQLAGVKASEWSWGAIFSDVDLDGYEDLIVATGMTRDFMDSDVRNKVNASREKLSLTDLLKTAEWFPTLPTRNVIYRNRGDLTFEYVSKDWGFEDEAVSGGVIQADFDNDGDLDLIFNNHHGPLEVYRNESTAPRISVRLAGLRPNTGAIGAKVRLVGGPGGTAPMEHEIQAGGGYASSSDPLVAFGTGRVTQGLKLEVIWYGRLGLTRSIVDAKPNHHYTIQQGVDDPEYVPPTPTPKPALFDIADVALAFSPTNGAPLVGSKHIELPFDDFKYQSLLPNRLSQLGPAVAWTDINGDGFDDLILGTGRGGGTVIYQGELNGKFTRMAGTGSRLDQAGVVGWTDGLGNHRILVALANYEVPNKEFAAPPSLESIELTTNVANVHLPGQTSTAGPLALADVDGNGTLDVFVGGRVNPARYPEPADSKLYLNDRGKLIPDTNNNGGVLQKIGLVSGAVFGDLDGDHDQDLVLALEWGPITVLRNDNGKFVNATEAFGLANLKGWWNSVQLGDFDGDGRLDIVAGNWGRNSKYEHSYSLTQPLRIAYSDFDTNGVLDIIEYHFDKTLGQMVPERGRSCTMRAMPFIGERNPTFDAFGSRSIEEVYGDCLAQGTVLEANTLEHTLFLNCGGKFEARALPIEAQCAPLFGINVADFDGDGNEDVFLAQNFFASQRETPRSDGGRSLLLRGDGKGRLTPVSAEESGLIVYGEQRGSAVSDYNRDGRPDLVVTQNGSFTRLFENKNGKRGLRVRLHGDKANPTGVGAVLRLRFGSDELGPARLVTAGSGYWSQDSAVKVLATPKPATHVEVLWPDGTKQSQKVVAGVIEIGVVKAASQP